MSSRPHRHNADLIDWRMLPLAVLCVALGGVISYSAASSFGLGYVGIDQLPRSVAELASIEKLPVKADTLAKSLAAAKTPPVGENPQLVNEPEIEEKGAAKKAESTGAVGPTSLSQTVTQEEDEAEAVTQSGDEREPVAEVAKITLPDTAEIVARANQAAGAKLAPKQDTVKVEAAPSRTNNNEYQEVRASLDPNSLPILRVELPATVESETVVREPETKEKLIASEQESLSKNIIDAVDSGVVSRVLSLIEKGEALDGIDETGQTMLLKAAWNGDEQMFDALLEQGASVHISSSDGRTALFGATVSGSLSLVKKLVEKGALVNVQTDDGKTPLMVSARSSYPEIALYLLEQGADPDIVDSKGRNALLYALWDRNIEVIRSLIQYGSSLDQIDNDGHATVDIARLRRIELPGMNLEESEESAN